MRVELIIAWLFLKFTHSQLFPCPERCQCYSDQETHNYVHLVCKWEQLNSTVLDTLARPDLIRTLTIRCSYLGHQVSNPSTHLFRELSSLERLELDRCRVKNVPGTFFAGLTQLYSLIMKKAALDDLPRNIFDYIPKLMTLDLSNNQLRMEPFGIRNLKNLIHLDLSNNNITFLTNTLVGLTNLRVLTLNNNQIGNIDFRRFPEGLTDLSIRNNRINNVHYVSQVVRNLKRLDLAGNRLQFIAGSSSGAVNVLPPSLRHLDLSNNQINYIQDGSFQVMETLGLLDLQNNSLSELKQSALKGPKELKVLLAENPFQCHCSTRWIIKSDKESKIDVADSGAVMCTSIIDSDLRILLEVAEKRNQLMCRYKNMCEANCSCCENKDCECRFECPNECTCYRSYNTSDEKMVRNVMHCDKLRLDKVQMLPSPLTSLKIEGAHWKKLDMDKLTRLQHLKSIVFSKTELTSEELEPLSSLKNLSHLEISSAELSDVPEWISKMPHLQQINLRNNSLKFSLKGLSGLQHVKKIKIGGKLKQGCSCEVPTDLQKWLSRQENLQKIQDIDEVTCDLDEFGTVKIEETLLTSGNISLCSNVNDTKHWLGVVENIQNKTLTTASTTSMASSPLSTTLSLTSLSTPTTTTKMKTSSAVVTTTMASLTTTIFRFTPKANNPTFADDNPHKLVNALIFLLFISVVLLIIAIGVTVYFKFMKLEEAQTKVVREDSGEFEPLNNN